MPNENDSKLVTLADLGVAYNDLNTNKKNIQTAVSDPTASGTAVSFIDSISQDAQGVIAPTKKTVSEATTSAAGLLSSTDKTKLDGIEAGAQVNMVTSVNGSTGAVVLDAEDVDAIAKDIPYDFTSNYTGNELIPLYNQTTEQNYSTSINALLSQAGGGGSSQGALVNYKKIVSLSAGSSSQSFNDDNITGDMVVLEAIIDTPSAQGSDWDVTTADGSVTISGTVNAATNLTLYFGVGMSTAPSLLTNLSSTSPANILSTAPRPGVMGVLGRENGGTGGNGIVYKGRLTKDDNVDNLHKSGFWDYVNGDRPYGISNSNITNLNGEIITYHLPGIPADHQICTIFGTMERWERRYWEGSWNDWTKVY